MKKKRITALISALTMSMSASLAYLPMPGNELYAKAENVSISDITEDISPKLKTESTSDGFEYNEDYDSIVITGYYGTSNSVVIPNKINNKYVVSIANDAFSGTSITSIELPESLTSIDSNAFRDCIYLTSITIPDNVKSVGNSCFSGCKRLASFSLGNNVEVLGDNILAGCQGIKEITIPRTVKETGNWEYGCLQYSSVETVIFEEGIENIPDNICKNVESVKKVIIPEKEDNLDGYTIGNRAFSGTSITSIELPESLTSIGYNAFSDCNYLTSITIPDSVVSIGSSCFSGCKRLTSFSLGNNVEVLGENILSGCQGIKEITIPKTVKETGNWEYGCLQYSSVETVLFEEGTENIPDNIFKGAESVKKVIIPASVTKVYGNEFESCTNLTDIIFMNPKCDISENSVYSGKTIHGLNDSTAEAYAKEYGYEFETINTDIPSAATTGTATTLTTTVITTAAEPITYSPTPTNTLTLTLIPYGFDTYDLDDDLYKIEATNSDIFVYTKLNRQLSIHAIAEGESDIYVYLVNGDWYLLKLTVNDSGYVITTKAETITDPVTTMSLSSTTSAATTSTTAAETTEKAPFQPGKDGMKFNNRIGQFVNGDSSLILRSDELNLIEKIKTFYNSNIMNAVIDDYIKSPGNGACYGMSALDLIYLSNREYYLNKLKPGAQNLHELALTEELKSIINYYCLTQCLPEIQQNIYDSTSISDSVFISELLTKLKDGPVMVCYKRKDISGSFLGHCIVAYDVVPYKPDVSDSTMNYLLSYLKYNENTDELLMIKVYDPVEDTRNEKYNIIVKVVNKGTDKESYIWNIKAISEYVKESADKKILMVSNDLDMINKYDAFDEWNIHGNGSLSNLSSSLNISAPDISSEDSLEFYKDDKLFGPWLGASDEEDDLFIEMPYFSGDSICSKNFILKYPNQHFGLKYSDGISRETNLRMRYQKIMFQIDADALKSVAFTPDSVIIDIGNNSTYSINIIKDETSNIKEFYNLKIKGTGSGKIGFRYDDGNGSWTLTTSSLNNEFDVYATNNSDCIDKYREFPNKDYPDKIYNSFMINYSSFENSKISINPKKINIEESSVNLGDINGDGIIDATDASEILTAYAQSSVEGNKSELTQKQTEAADVNKDGTVDATDASTVLTYYAISSTIFTGTFEDYLVSLK